MIGVLSKEMGDALSVLFDRMILEESTPFEIAGNLQGLAMAVLARKIGPAMAREVLESTLRGLGGSRAMVMH